MKADLFFNPEEQKQIEATIAAVERSTSGEIAVMVVESSDDYPEAAILCGLLLGLSFALVISEFFFDGALVVFLPIFLGLGITIGYLATRIPSLLRWFGHPSRIEQRVRNRAIQSFYEKELYKTRDNTGVLFFLSILERKVFLLADKGIYTKVSQEQLQGHTAAIVSGIHNGEPGLALCREIRAVGEVLARHFPIKPDDTNELPNRIERVQ